MFFFGKKADINIELSYDGKRKICKSSDDKEHYVYYDGESISGKVNINIQSGKKFEHQGIIIELIGKIEFMYDRGTSREFLKLERDLARPGILNSGLVSYPWEFKCVQKPYETYHGINMHLRYFVRVQVVQRLNNIIRELEFEVQQLSKYSEAMEPLKMEVGIEDSLHIEFEYSSTRYHLDEVMLGKIYFILVRVKVKSMEVQVIRHESVGRGPGVYMEATHMKKYEIMDGAPVRGECIPVRIFFKDMDGLRPTMMDIDNCFSVRYFLNLVLTDEEDRRYYKQQEIFLYRKSNMMHQRTAVTPKSAPSTKVLAVPQRPDLVETSKVTVTDDGHSREKDESWSERDVDSVCSASASEPVSLKSPDIMESCKVEPCQ